LVELNFEETFSGMARALALRTVLLAVSPILHVMLSLMLNPPF
jgi:hypothetical protein